MTESSQQYLDVAGAAANGVVFGADFTPGGRDPAGRKFVADFQARFGAKADNYAAISYTMMQVAALAIKNAGPNPDRQKVRDALAATKNFPVIIGQGRFSLAADRSVHYDASLLTIRNGKYEPVE
jgi:branched-chain amino acid transport system substrate-binding protein